MEKKILDRLQKYYNSKLIEVIKLNQKEYEIKCNFNYFEINFIYLYEVNRSFDFNVANLVRKINYLIIEEHRKGVNK